MASETIKKNDVSPGQMAAFEVEGRRVAVANVGGTLYAFDDTCTHRQCSLAEGTLEGTTVTCPCHGSEFRITNGAVVTGPAPSPLPAKQIKIVDGQVILL